MPGWDPLDLYRERYAETGGAEPLARMQDVDLGIYLVDDLLVKTDRSAWPTRWSCASPSSTSGWPSSRWRCRRALQGARASPRSACCARPWRRCCRARSCTDRKQGFSIPLAAWLRGPLEPFAREVLSPATLERQGCLDPSAVTPLLDRHCSGREDLSRQLWGLMAFTLWFDRYAV